MIKPLGVCLLVWSLAGPALRAQATTGTLVFDVKPFASEIELKEKVRKQLAAAGLEWGVADGQLVVSMVSKQFLNFELPHLTRYGTQKTLELEPGTYRITCVGFVPEGGMSVEKILNKGAYFNLDVLTFEVGPGKTTTLEVQPTIRKKSTFFIKFFIPDLLVKVLGEGTTGAERVINEKTPESIAWADYNGPLKFSAP